MHAGPAHAHASANPRSASQEPPAVSTRATPVLGLELRQLRYLVALAEELNMTRAAARLHLTQPALSQAMHNLELRIGLRMFDRVPRGIELTEPGQAFIAHARTVVMAADAAEAAAARLAAHRDNQLGIGFTSGLMLIAGRLVCSLRREAPAVEIKIKRMAPGALVEGLTAGTVDIGLASPELRGAGVVTISAMTVPLVAVIATEHPLVSESIASTKELSNIELVGPWAQELSRDAGRDIDPQALNSRTDDEPRSLEEAWPDILASHAVAVLPTFVADKYQMPGVTSLHLADRPQTTVAVSRRNVETHPLPYQALQLPAATARQSTGPEKALHLVEPSAAKGPGTRTVLPACRASSKIG